jgi:hypothetical protein
MSMDLLETILKLSGVAYKGSPVEQFMNKLDGMTERSPLDSGEYLLDGCRIHCGPTDMNKGVRINDMQSMQKGAGSVALGKLCALADEFGVPLSLTAKGFSANPTPTPVLVKWYSRFGFVSGMGSMKDGMNMKRVPKQGKLDLSGDAEPRIIKLRGFGKRPH